MKAFLIKLSKYRLVYGYAVGLLCLALVKDQLLPAGIILAAVGAAIRIWAAGTVWKDNQLATTGPYALTRNPLYFGSFLMGVGAVVAIKAWWLVPVYILGFALFYIGAFILEDMIMEEMFLSQYREYRRRVPVFFPWKPCPSISKFSLSQVTYNREHKTFAATGLMFALMEIIYLAKHALAGRF